MGLTNSACQICDAESERRTQRTCFQPGWIKGAHSQLQVWPITSTALLKDVMESDWGCKLEALICPVSTRPGEVRAVLIQAVPASSPLPGLKRENPSFLVHLFPPPRKSTFRKQFCRPGNRLKLHVVLLSLNLLAWFPSRCLSLVPVNQAV